MITAKARDMLRHYVSTVMPNGLKAQVVAVSRLAAVRYALALRKAHTELVDHLRSLAPAMLTLANEDLEAQNEETRFLVSAHAHLSTIERLEFAAVISGNHNDDSDWKMWSDKAKIDGYIANFKKPLVAARPDEQHGLAFLCVKSMLLTGFDAPVEQVLYLDRRIEGHTLLQAIARVNRTYPGKHAGLIVDYFGVARHLGEALADYDQADVQAAQVSIAEELPRLAERHRAVLEVFRSRTHEIANVNACVDLLADPAVRQEFEQKLKSFLKSMDIVLPRPEALQYVHDAKLLGLINKAAANRYRDSELNIMGAGEKVRELIDRYIEAQGIDPSLPPISILDKDFLTKVDVLPSQQAKALEMEHAARYHISRHFQEDPAYYKRLSERLEEILHQLELNWDDLTAMLREFTTVVRQGRPADDSGLDPATQAPFLGILVEEAGATGDKERITPLIAPTVELVDHIRQEIGIVDFWKNPVAQDILRKWIVKYLASQNLLPFKLRPVAAGRIMDLARVLHTRLVP